MLTALSIRDIVLIEKLDISLEKGLTVLTGETGAGKSILLDALGLALGARGDSSLVRTGAERGVVTAAFALPRTHPAFRHPQGAGESMPRANSSSAASRMPMAPAAPPSTTSR